MLHTCFLSLSSIIWKHGLFQGHTFKQPSDKCIHCLSAHTNRLSWGGKRTCHSFQVAHSVYSRGSKLLVRKWDSDKRLSAGALSEIESKATEPTLTFKSYRADSVPWVRVEMVSKLEKDWGGGGGVEGVEEAVGSGWAVFQVWLTTQLTITFIGGHWKSNRN